MKKKKIEINEDLNSLGIFVPIEYGFYTVDDVLGGNLSILPDGIRENLVTRIHDLGFKLDNELTIDEMQKRTDTRESLDFSFVNKGHRIDFAYENIDLIDNFIDRKIELENAMKKLPYTNFIDGEEAEAWLKFVGKNRKLIEFIEKENTRVLTMLKNKMDISILK